MKPTGVSVSRDHAARGWSLSMRLSPFKGGGRVFIRRNPPPCKKLVVVDVLPSRCHRHAVAEFLRPADHDRLLFVDAAPPVVPRRSCRLRVVVVARRIHSRHARRRVVVPCGWCLLTRRHLCSRGEVVAFVVVVARRTQSRHARCRVVVSLPGREDFYAARPRMRCGRGYF